MLTLPHRPARLAVSSALAIAIALLIAAVLWAILNAATEPSSASRVDILHLLRMTAIQAGLTTVLSLSVGTALAWALNRLRFPGRDFVVGLFAAAIVTPGMVVAFGLLSIWGRNGWINQTSEALFGFSLGNPAFGLSGILLAHVILDGAFAARILLARLDAVPATRLKVGQSLALSAAQRFALIDWPAMRSSLPGLGAIIFLLAFTSFPIVLLLGGGPANQTLEVAIYSAVRLDFDLVGAVRLAATQIVVCAVVILLASASTPVVTVHGRSTAPRWRDAMPARALQWLVLGIATVGFALPLISVLIDGVMSGFGRVLAQPTFWWALTTSLVIGSASAALTLVLALALTLGRAASGRRGVRILLGTPSFAYLAVPAVVLSLGFFLIVRNLGLAPAQAAPVVVIIANSLLALPFAVATLGPPLDAVARARGKLIRSLGLSGWQQFWRVEYPLLGKDIGLMLALAFCFSLGDLGVIALFGTQDFQTLPLMMFRALGAYRSNDAAAIAAILLVGTIVAFVGLPRLLKGLPMLRAEHLAFAYGAGTQDYDFSFGAEAGVVTAISGASGSGKSTLFDLLAGFLTPQSGTLDLDGRNLLPLPPETRPLSLLLQSDNLFDHLTAAENVALGLPRGTAKAEGRERVEEVMMRIGLDGLGGQTAATLSGGQKQRVALARTLLRDRAVLLLDEPFSALDDETRVVIRALVGELTASQGWHTILVSHHEDDIAALATRRYRLEKGRLAPA